LGRWQRWNHRRTGTVARGGSQKVVVYATVQGGRIVKVTHGGTRPGTRPHLDQQARPTSANPPRHGDALSGPTYGQPVTVYVRASRSACRRMISRQIVAARRQLRPWCHDPNLPCSAPIGKGTVCGPRERSTTHCLHGRRGWSRENSHRSPCAHAVTLGATRWGRDANDLVSLRRDEALVRQVALGDPSLSRLDRLVVRILTDVQSLLLNVLFC
jgi:hypothetical protein